MPHMSPLILSNLYSSPAAGLTASLCESLIGWPASSFIQPLRCAPFLCKWTVYYADGIAAELRSAGAGWVGEGQVVVGGLWEDGSDGAVKDKGWSFPVCPRRGGGWGSYTIDLQLRGPANGFYF